ncbi:MAG: transketolase C-terminal domain-containing protein [Nannocystaceae bacterium]
MMSVLDQLAATLADLVDEDPRRVLLGEDVRDGGMLGLSRATMAREHLHTRVAAMPLTPASTWTHAAGLALGGMRPIILSPSADALLEGFAGLLEMSSTHWRSGDQRPVPVLTLAPVGPGFGLGTGHASSPETLLASVPGLRVVVVGRAEHAAAYLRAAASFSAGEEPTVLLLPRTVLLQDTDTGQHELKHTFGHASPLTRGDTVTVFAWGPTVELALAAAAASECSVSVIDVSSLCPLDETTLVSEANRTGKVVITHSGPHAFGMGAEIAARLAQHSIMHLDAPVLRIAGEPGPYAPGDESRALPTLPAITEAIRQVASY